MSTFLKVLFGLLRAAGAIACIAAGTAAGIYLYTNVLGSGSSNAAAGG